MLNLSSDFSPATTLTNPDLPQITNSGGGYTLSGDRSTGVGPALPVILSGQVSNVGQGTLSFDSSSSGIGSVTLTDGWTGSDLQTQIDSLTWTAEDVLQNGALNDYHSEQFIITTDPSYNAEAHRVPDGWTLFKNVQSDTGTNAHPNHGVYELYSQSSGYGSTWGVRFDADWGTGFVHSPNDEIFFRQMVSLPWRQVYSAEITFRYYVYSSSALADQVHLFVRLGGELVKFHVFESGDITDTWLQATTIIQAASMSDLSTHVSEFDIGLASDLTGTTNAYFSRVHVDDVKVDFTVRPFPEQIDLKANGTLVWGSTSHSIYPYVPDDDNRDCYDEASTGIDLDGYSGTGELETGMYSSGFLTGTQFETGMQFPVDIPQGAIITSAYLEVEAAYSSSPNLYGMRIHVADEDNVASFTTGLPHLEDRFSWVETTVDWSISSWITAVDTRYRSPEIGPLLQKVVSRSEWSEGNYICIMTSHMYSDYYQRWNAIKGTVGFDGDERARLFVEYIIPEPEDTVLFFDFERDITIDHNDVVSDLLNFPVLIDMTDAHLRDNVQSNGNDIAFTIDGTSVAHEIELYDMSTGHLVAWVKVPFLSGSADTIITMHYGCENAPPALGSRVWSDYETVQHLNQDPTGINYDSTSNNHDGTSYGGLGSSDLVSGQIGNAIDFDGNNDVISIGQVDTDEWTGFTMSAWFYRTLNKDARVFSKSDTTDPSYHIITLRLDPINHVTTRIRVDDSSTGYGVSYSSIAAASNFTWHHIAWSWDASRTNHEIMAYLDGVLIIDRAYSGTSIYDSDAMFVIGNNDLTNARWWAGRIDEARLTTIVRSEAWIDTEYNNQANPSGFYSVGSPHVIPDTWIDAGETRVVFTTSSPGTVTMDVNMVMDVGGVAQTMDENFDNGVSYFIESGATIVNWTAKVMVSPPSGATSFGFTVEYPRAEWKATKVLNPLNQPKSLGSDWWYEGGTLTLYATAIDFWGVWTLKFISWNFLEDLQTDSPSYDVGDIAKFTMTTPTVLGARVGLDLVDPNGVTWYSAYNQTTTDPAHKFPSFKYRKVITIPSTQMIYGSVNNFPVLVQIEDTQLHDPTRVRSDASDIMFASGNTVLDHEIEYFDQNYFVNTALLVAWVKTNLTAGVDNYITMYYGSPVVDNLENPAGVWSNDFEAVWHLGETGSTHYDSSGNNYDGMRNGNTQVSARVGFGQNFDGSNDYIAFDETLTPENDVLITGWFRPTVSHNANSPTTQVIMEKYIDIDHDMVIALVGQDYAQGTVPNGTLVFKVESAENDPMYKWTTRTTWTAGQWYYIACYADEDNPANNKIWVNLAWSTDAGQVGSASQANMSYVEEWRLGGGNYETSYEGSGYFNGRLDEFRVSKSSRSDGWLRYEANNQLTPSTFLSVGTEQTRTSPNHSLKQTIASTFAAGQWTAIAYYNDTGNSISNKTGLFERTFIVRHDTSLTLSKPSDAVGDRLSVKTVGDSLFVEYQLKDTDAAGNPGVEGATVTMNWTTPSTITLDDYGGGLYRTALETTDLGDNQRWRIEVASSHPYYNNAYEYFDLDLYHTTDLDASGVTTTPADFDFATTLTFEDEYTGAPISGATITYENGNPVSFVDNFDGTYDISIPTGALSLGQHQYTFNATKSGAYLHVGQVDVTFTLRAHKTVLSVSGDMETPYGEDTQVTIFLLDLDTGLAVDISDVGTMTFSYTGGYASDIVGSYSATLTTADWNVGSVTATLTVTISNSKISAPTAYVFGINILAHRTSLTVTGVSTIPYGNMTTLHVILTDLEDGSIVPIGTVSNIRFQRIVGVPQDFSGSYDILLDTHDWVVGTHTVTVIVTMSGTIYSAPTNYQFVVTIRSMTSEMYHGPSTLNFTIGSDFTVNLHLNISEQGPFYGDPITGRVAGEFSVPGYTISIDTSQQAIGLYKLTIDDAYFTGGSYQITVHFDSASNLYADTFLVIQFSYREIVSYLSSPNYPQVTTPYQLDVEIILEFADADFGSGIEGATITSPDHPSWIANWTDETGGLYSVWIDVATLTKGTHYISLTADKSGFTARTLQFRIVIRDAYTSAISSVGSLDIPIGNSPVFYVDYTDLDREETIGNLTLPYTQVISTWGNFSVEYLSGTEQYKITFHTSDSDPFDLNKVYTFTFSKDNYQSAQVSITVTIRTHNTDFRIVSSIEPTSTTGTFNISVYYGDLDNAIGIKSALVVFSVSNASGPVVSSYDYDDTLGDGFYIIQVSASQFGLGLQAFTVYADWTGAVAKYKDKSFLTSANVVGKESALTLLVGSEPTAYNEDMGYTFFYSDLFSGDGIDNLTYNVFIYVSFQGEAVNPADILITDFSATDPGKYSVEFNNGIFSRTGLIYMNVFVNWSKGVAPFYANRTDVVSVRVLPRETLLSITPAAPTSYGENATLTLTFEDTTGGSSTLITGLTKQHISLSISFSYVENAGTYTISFNTNQFGSLGVKAITAGVTWVGTPFYANRTGRVTYVSVVARVTNLEYLTPPPTQYGDQVIFNVTWTDITGGASDPITSATLVLKYGVAYTPVPITEYEYTEVEPGVYQVILNTTYALNPGTDILRVEISSLEFYYSVKTINRFFTVQMRATLVAANPVADIPFGSNIVIVVSYLDLFIQSSIANDSAHGYPVNIEVMPSGQTFTSSWRAVSQNYQLTISWNPSWDATWLPGTMHSFTVLMSYDSIAPFYDDNQAYVTFKVRIRASSLALDTEPETTPYLDNVSFTIFYSDDDAAGLGISGANILITGLTETQDFVVSEGSAGYYTISVFTTSLGSLGTHILDVIADWTGAPHHADETRDVSVLVRTRATNLEVTVPPAQTLYLDDVTFEFEFNDLDASTSIISLNPSIIHLYWSNMTEISQGDYSVVESSGTYELTISSTTLSAMPVTGLSIRLVVDWPAAVAPFYADDFTIVKVTITGRSILVETEQIERTPKGDILNITVNLSDLENGNPIAGAIIQFSCRDNPLTEGDDYIYTPGLGVYTFNIYTMSLSFPFTGTFLFDIEVQWNPNLSPFYSNRSVVTLTGLVDLVRTSLQVNAIVPSSVQYTGTVSLNVTWKDLDHNLPVTGYAAIIDSNVKYLIGGSRPAGLVVYEYESSGVYNITFTTSDLPSLGTYTLRIVAAVSIYASVTVTPQFNMIAINTVLTPVETSTSAYWKESATISVDYLDLLHGINIDNADSVTWTYDILGLGDSLSEIGSTGRYTATIDTLDFEAGTYVITVTATKDSYVTSITTITLVVLTIPSEIIIYQPTEIVKEVSRGDPVYIEVTLWDINNGLSIDETKVRNITGNLQVFARLEGIVYYMAYNVFTGNWSVTIPGSATLLQTLLDYDIQIFASFKSYDPAVDQFKIYVTQTATQLSIIGSQILEVYYLQNATINLNFTATAVDMLIDNGTVRWLDDDRNISLYFVSLGSGVWTLTFNTSILGFGTVGASFYGTPANSSLKKTVTSMTLTIKNVPTDVVYPTETLELIWGWTGNITLDYIDVYNGRYVPGATVTYSYGNLDFNATDLGNGTYALFINTTLLDSNIRERISTLFFIANYETQSRSFFIRVLERPTELIVGYPEQNFVKIDEGKIYLELTMGDSILISLFYNDTSLIGGLLGGIIDANFSEFTMMVAPEYIGLGNNMSIVFQRGFGFYNFTFDTNVLALYSEFENYPTIREGKYFNFYIEIFDENRKQQAIQIYIEIISISTAIIHDGQLVDPEDNIEYTLINGESIIFDLYVNDTWHGWGVDAVAFEISRGAQAIISINTSLGNGYYRLVILAVGYGGDSVIRITMSSEYHDNVEMGFLIHTLPNDIDILFINITRYGLPISFVIIVLLGAYVKVWSVPKRIRQINGQLKQLRKGKVPKPIGDVKSRQQLSAELFNDTFEKMKITRTAAQMPEDAIPIEVPEMGELLMQLSILTNLSPEELDEFQADIAKMKMSEQAAFVKEVIMQEAIRAARREGRTVEETLAILEQEAHHRLGGEEEVEPSDVIEPEPVEKVFLEEAEEEVRVAPKEEVTRVEKAEFEEVTETISEKMSLFEIEELRKDLERRGIPPHEIETIIEQAKELPRELVDELVRSLEGKRD